MIIYCLKQLFSVNSLKLRPPYSSAWCMRSLYEYRHSRIAHVCVLRIYWLLATYESKQASVYRLVLMRVRVSACCSLCVFVPTTDHICALHQNVNDQMVTRSAHCAGFCTPVPASVKLLISQLSLIIICFFNVKNLIFVAHEHPNKLSLMKNSFFVLLCVFHRAGLEL